MEKSNRQQPDRPAPGTTRADRLAEELRANLMKRKAQARSRKAGDTPASGSDAPE